MERITVDPEEAKMASIADLMQRLCSSEKVLSGSEVKIFILTS